MIYHAFYEKIIGVRTILRVTVYREPLEKWQDIGNGINFFDLYKENPMEYGLAFELLVALTMLKRNIKANESNEKPIHVHTYSKDH